MAFQDTSRFSASAPCDPKNVNKVTEEVHRMFQAFADEGPSEEELTNAKEQIANNLDTDMKEPRYWMGVLRHLDLHERNLDDEKGKVDAYRRYTVKQVRDVFRKYYTQDRQFKITATPTKAPPSEGGKKKEKETAPAS